MKYRCPGCGFIWECEGAEAIMPTCFCNGSNKHGTICIPLPAEMPSDQAVVERFNELVKKKRVQYMQCTGVRAPFIGIDTFTLRPTPRYRAFTAVEAAGQLGRRIEIHEFFNGEFAVKNDGILVGVDRKWFNYQYACDHGKFTDTGEPFGMRED